MGNSQSKLAYTSPPLFEAFTRLPLELRLKVYGYTLSEDVQPVLVDRRNDLESEYLPELSVGLLRVSRQVRDEVGPMYYKLNTFRFLKPEGLLEWLCGLDAEQTDQLRSIECKLEMCKYSAAAIKLLAKCGNLQELTIPFDFNEVMVFLTRHLMVQPVMTGSYGLTEGPYLGLLTKSWIGIGTNRPKYPTRLQLARMDLDGCRDIGFICPGLHMRRIAPIIKHRMDEVLKASGWSEDESENGDTALGDFEEWVDAVNSVGQLLPTDLKGCRARDGREQVQMEIEKWDKILRIAAMFS